MHSLGAKEFIEMVVTGSCPSYFAVGAINLPPDGTDPIRLLEHQRRIVAEYFCDPDRGGVFEPVTKKLPVSVGNVTFWPLQVMPHEQ